MEAEVARARAGLVAAEELGAMRTAIAAMEAERVTMRADLAAMRADLAAMRADLAAMRADFAAMRAAQAGNACPGGFDENLFRVLCSQADDKQDFQKRIDDQQKDIRDQQKDIRDQQKDIRDQQRRIDDQQKDIRDQQKDIQDQQSNLQQEICEEQRSNIQQEFVLGRHTERGLPVQGDDPCPPLALAACHMNYVVLKLSGVNGTGVKTKIWLYAQRLRLGGFVKRESSRDFTMLAVYPSMRKNDCEEFISDVQLLFGSQRVSVGRPQLGNNARLATYYSQGFKRVYRADVQGASSMDLSPEDDADAVSLLSINSAQLCH